MKNERTVCPPHLRRYWVIFMDEKLCRDYDVRSIKTDKRFVHCRNDMILVHAVYLGSDVLIIVLAYLLSPSAPGDITYFLGYPLWFTAGALICLGQVLFTIGWALRRRRFSFKARADDSEVDE